ncbi:hypothetical protein P154DRAFT_354219 [Amniculicola lignicola CBS 123094]|uniref:Uncharacterized protein n=1 Tax=Amniculicola lignicola CBS 123094 TaxID=1392246 RepID=A0A6A5WUB8_9PLEO|nr:hypothetical protein P154DRAFT_354219 [Amniculicola lignicola CBS 123094]
MWPTFKTFDPSMPPHGLEVTRPWTPPEQDDSAEYEPAGSLHATYHPSTIHGHPVPRLREAAAAPSAAPSAPSTPMRDVTRIQTLNSSSSGYGPQLPDTPESSRTATHHHLFRPLSPLPPMLWDTDSLLAPGCAADSLTSPEAAHYIQEVGLYIEEVKKNAADLKKRFDEVKQLNDIQLECIAELRRQLAEARLAADSPETNSLHKAEKPSAIVPEPEEPAATEPEAEEPVATEPEAAKTVDKPSKWQFWGAFKDALDMVGEMLFEE